jgi:hypothetical protein
MMDDSLADGSAGSGQSGVRRSFYLRRTLLICRMALMADHGGRQRLHVLFATNDEVKRSLHRLRELGYISRNDNVSLPGRY